MEDPNSATDFDEPFDIADRLNLLATAAAACLLGCIRKPDVGEFANEAVLSISGMLTFISSARMHDAERYHVVESRLTDYGASIGGVETSLSNLTCMLPWTADAASRCVDVLARFAMVVIRVKMDILVDEGDIAFVAEATDSATDTDDLT